MPGHKVYQGDGMKDTGFKMMKKSNEFNFLKWGEYMKRANLAERKNEKLKSLILLTDPVVENEVMNDIAMKQWLEFIKCFPDEAR